MMMSFGKSMHFQPCLGYFSIIWYQLWPPMIQPLAKKKKSNAGLTVVWNKGHNYVSIFSQTNYKNLYIKQSPFLHHPFCHPPFPFPGQPPPTLSPTLVLLSLLFNFNSCWLQNLCLLSIQLYTCNETPRPPVSTT